MVKGSSRYYKYIFKAHSCDRKITEQNFQNINYKQIQIKKKKKDTLKIIIYILSKLLRLKRQL